MPLYLKRKAAVKTLRTIQATCCDTKTARRSALAKQAPWTRDWTVRHHIGLSGLRYSKISGAGFTGRLGIGKL